MTQLSRSVRIIPHTRRLFHKSTTNSSGTATYEEDLLLQRLLHWKNYKIPEEVQEKEYSVIINDFKKTCTMKTDSKNPSTVRFVLSRRIATNSTNSVNADDLGARLKAITTKPGVSVKDISAFIEINSAASKSDLLPAERADLLKQIVELATPTSLRATMQYLVKLWPKLPDSAANLSYQLVSTILVKAAEIHKRTFFTISHGQLSEIPGIEDMEAFESLFAAFQTRFGTSDQVSRAQTENLMNLHLELLCHCGSLENAQIQLDSLMDEQFSLSRRALSAYLELLGESLKIRRDLFEANHDAFLRANVKSLEFVQKICANKPTLPAQIKFRLNVFITKPAELFTLLNQIEKFPSRNDIYEACQRNILDTAFDLYPLHTLENRLTAVASWFALMERLQRHTKVYAETWNDLMLKCAKLGNAAGVLRILNLYDESSSAGQIDSAVIGELLDHFPLPQFLGSNEALVEQVLQSLEKYMTPQLWPKYITASLRRGIADLFVSEWERLSNQIESPEAILAFVSGFVSLELPKYALEALKRGFDTDARMEILRDIQYHELLPDSLVYRAIAESAAKSMWSEQDLEAAIGHIENAVSAVLHQDQGQIDDLWPRQEIE